MDVYVLTEWYGDCDHSAPLGAFGSLEAAQAEADARLRRAYRAKAENPELSPQAGDSAIRAYVRASTREALATPPTWRHDAPDSWLLAGLVGGRYVIDRLTLDA